METLTFPDMLPGYEDRINLDQGLFFCNYKAAAESVKNKAIFKKNMINFIISGNKIIETLDRSYQINDSQAIIIKNGNCLTTEKFSKNSRFSSLTFFFDTKNLNEFFLKHSSILSNSKNTLIQGDPDIYIFEKDSFIESYIHSVQNILQMNHPFPELLQLKFEEIILYLFHKKGTSFLSFISSLLVDTKDLNFKATVESESLNKFTLDEIAFLCNMSLSTFKRHFTKSFGLAPQKWFQQKRMKYAYESIKTNQKTPSDLYLELGYNSLSSFSVAFSKVYGCPPTKIIEINNRAF